MHFVRTFVRCLYSSGKPLWRQKLPKHIGQYLYVITYISVVQWLRCCATNRKVAGSIPAGDNGMFY